MARTTITCAFCGNEHQKESGQVNRNRKLGRESFCSIECASARRTQKIDSAGGTCTACEEADKPDGRCGETFTCGTCGKNLNSCRFRAQGMDGEPIECVHCYEERVLGPEWREAWRLRERKWTVRTDRRREKREKVAAS